MTTKPTPVVTKDSPLTDRINAYLRQQDACSVHPKVYQSYQLLDESLREAAELRKQLEAERKAREDEEERLTVKCGGANALGGCGKNMPIGSAYRCSDCEQYFHRDCLREHCETSSYVTAIRQNTELINGWKSDVSKATERATTAEVALKEAEAQRVEDLRRCETELMTFLETEYPMTRKPLQAAVKSVLSDAFPEIKS
jgi:hypothetical protein